MIPGLQTSTRDFDLGSLSKDTQVTCCPPLPPSSLHPPPPTPAGAALRDKACPCESQGQVLPGAQLGVPRGGQLGLGL